MKRKGNYSINSMSLIGKIAILRSMSFKALSQGNSEILKETGLEILGSLIYLELIELWIKIMI